MRSLQFLEKDIIEQLIIKSKDKIVVLYGAGFDGKEVLINLLKLKDFEENLFRNIFFADDDTYKLNKKINIENKEYKIEKLENLINTYGKDNLVIIISTFYIDKILNRLDSFDLDMNNVFFLDRLFIEDLNIDYLKENEEKIDKVFNFLVDSKSKMLYNSIFDGKIKKDSRMMCYFKDEIQYFPKDIFEISENEVFVDGGAFNGDTIREFINQSFGKYKKIYAFEPDKNNYKNLIGENYSDFIAYNQGLYSKETELRFIGNIGASARIGENGESIIKVNALDNMNLEYIPTFIKMDIEGSEMEALIGAKNTIKNNKPKLAICIYHKIEDLWQIALFIKELVPEYKLYIRNYKNNFDEVVLYAIL